MHQGRALRWCAVSLLMAAALLAAFAAPVALAAEPTPTPAVASARDDEDLAGPLIGLSLAMASSALAVGVALGLRRRIDEIGDEGDARGRE